ncbi:Pycsar system effector family protein [Vibrio ordalii]|uniref:Pycsar effector protein domain-containing protein n=1 Tax=Vibrio ordalii FS-238 TaxID=617133 RepID=A0A853R6V8_9VIBR|nr:Pycsar system effector family protein [Vibrio ordalii]OEE42452.1 hypothetical protein A1QS_12040 [Vibrio ordalii FS-238]
MIDVLKDTLSKVNDWVKYAEAKNAANIAFCSASIWGIFRVMSSSQNLDSYIHAYLMMSISLLAIGLCISFISFIPKLNTPWFKVPKREKGENLLYFGVARKYSAKSYVEELYDGQPENSDNYKVDLMYADQIIINSKVAWAKFKQFDFAVVFTLSAILSPLFILILKVCKK